MSGTSLGGVGRRENALALRWWAFLPKFSIGNLKFSQSTGPDASEPISALSLQGNYVWATAGPEVLQYETGKQVSRLAPPYHSTL